VQALIEKPEARVVEGSGGLLLEVEGQIVPNYDATMQPFEEGEVVTGRVVRIDKDEVLVDIGYKSEGVIPSGELSIRKSVDPREEVQLGEEVDAIVLTKEDQDGRLIMSKKRARFEKAWRRIEAAAESGQPVEGNVIEVVKGGLIIDLGVRGFLPASLVDIRRVPNLDEYMGTKIETKVIELNRSRNNVVLSRRAVLEEERKEVRQQILDRLQPGLVVEGQISNIVDFGAFVDLDGIDGLIHISELSWSHVNHPSEILNIGDTVQVKVLDIDRDRQRISLGLKQTQEDPWQRIVDTYNVGDELEGTVTKVVTFGAFVEILDGVEGLVHISELAVHHVESPREVVHPGDEIRVKILEIDSERRRLSLSAKRVEDQILPLPRADAPAVPPAAADAPAPGDAAPVVAEQPTSATEAVESGAAVETPAPEAGAAEAGALEAAGEAPAPEAGTAEGATEAGAVEDLPAGEAPAEISSSESEPASTEPEVAGETPETGVVEDVPAGEAAAEVAPEVLPSESEPASTEPEIAGEDPEAGAVEVSAAEAVAPVAEAVPEAEVESAAEVEAEPAAEAPASEPELAQPEAAAATPAPEPEPEPEPVPAAADTPQD
jgi:small subunit ribosomal protein S1